MQTQTQSRTKTSDLPFSAFLIVRGQALAGTERSGNQITFVFATTPEEFSAQQSAWLGGQTVPGLAFATLLAELKALAMQELRRSTESTVDVLASRGRP
jgi:hypothetical protein